MKKFNADAVAGLIVAAVGAFFFVMTLTNPQMSFVSKTSDGVPGGGFFPYILSVLLVVLGLALTGRSLKNEPVKYVEMTEENRKNLKTMLLTIAGFIVFLAAWKITAPYFGNPAFMVCVFLFEIFLNKLFERTWKFTLIYASVFTVFIYLVFNVAFSILFNA